MGELEEVQWLCQSHMNGEGLGSVFKYFDLEITHVKIIHRGRDKMPHLFKNSLCVPFNLKWNRFEWNFKKCFLFFILYSETFLTFETHYSSSCCWSENIFTQGTMSCAQVILAISQEGQGFVLTFKCILLYSHHLSFPLFPEHLAPYGSEFSLGTVQRS